MSSTLSTQNRQTFLRRKYCFFPVAIALSPPVGRCEAAMGRPPLCSAMKILLYLSSILSPALAAGADGGTPGAPGAPGIGAGASCGRAGEAIAGMEGAGGGLRAGGFRGGFFR